MGDIVDRAKTLPADLILEVQVAALSALVVTRDERLRAVEVELHNEKRLRETEGNLLRHLLSQKDEEIEKLRNQLAARVAEIERLREGGERVQEQENARGR